MAIVVALSATLGSGALAVRAVLDASLSVNPAATQAAPGAEVTATASPSAPASSPPGDGATPAPAETSRPIQSSPTGSSAGAIVAVPVAFLGGTPTATGSTPAPTPTTSPAPPSPAKPAIPAAPAAPAGCLEAEWDKDRQVWKCHLDDDEVEHD